jgi:membrane protein
MATVAGARRQVLSVWRSARPLLEAIVQAFRELSLITYGSALAFRALVSLIPLTLLGLGLLGALGLGEVWRDSIAPAIRDRVTPQVFRAIDSSVERIISTADTGLILLAGALALWHLTMAMRTVTVALNRIHGKEESRPAAKRIAISIGLAVSTAACLIGGMLVLLAGPRGENGALHVVLATGRWAIAVLLLTLAVGLVVRYAPAERPQASWASAGSVLIIGVWILASIGFRWFVGSLADFESAVGSLTVFLVLTTYVFTTSAIFLVGVQLDEVLRKGTD